MRAIIFQGLRSLPIVVVGNALCFSSSRTVSLGHPSASVTPDIPYRESILISIQMDPRYQLAGMTEQHGPMRHCASCPCPLPSLPTACIGSPSRLQCLPHRCPSRLTPSPDESPLPNCGDDKKERWVTLTTHDGDGDRAVTSP
ncbi:MAG: hypothetical protein H0X47_10730 [Nitrospirales bacterium]|nr:hypothetical protein [Nitrospirales bacterium]